MSFKILKKDSHFHNLRVKQLVGGVTNSATGDLAVVVGGCGNSASGDKSFVGSGFKNTASGDRSFIGGGENNLASGNESVIGGGKNNVTSGSQTFIGSGYGNQATQGGASVLGGFQNIASNYNSTVSGGANNVSSGFDSMVSGGNTNKALANWSTISGGKDNTIGEYSQYATIIGGNENTAGSSYSTVLGGRGNYAQAELSSASGQFALAQSYGQQAFSSGPFNSQGSAQCSKYVLRGTTTDNTGTTLYLDGSSQQIKISNSSLWALNVIVVGTFDTPDMDGFHNSTGFTYEGLVTCNDGGIVTITPKNVSQPESLKPFPIGTLIVDSAGSNNLRIKVESPSDPMHWVGKIETVEVKLS